MIKKYYLVPILTSYESLVRPCAE